MRKRNFHEEDNLNEDNGEVIGYCGYCHREIFRGEGVITVNGIYYHYDKYNPLNNCYFPEEIDEENIESDEE